MYNRTKIRNKQNFMIFIYFSCNIRYNGLNFSRLILYTPFLQRNEWFVTIIKNLNITTYMSYTKRYLHLTLVRRGYSHPCLSEHALEQWPQEIARIANLWSLLSEYSTGKIYKIFLNKILIQLNLYSKSKIPIANSILSVKKSVARPYQANYCYILFCYIVIACYKEIISHQN